VVPTVKVDVLCFQDLFDRRIHFAVPLFQRGYVWGQDANWAPLWAELLDAVYRPDETHFLGVLVLEQAPMPTAATETRRVVDGQQRLTTLQVILAAIRDVAATFDRPELVARLTALTINPSRTGTDSPLKVLPSGADRDAFRAVMTSGSGAAVAGSYAGEPPAIVRAYQYFSGRITALLDADRPEDREATLHRLVEAITRGLGVIVVDLDPPDDPQAIFESLNARGTPLRAGDLVRNALFHQCAFLGEPIEPLYTRFWAPFDNEYWLARPAEGTDTPSRMDAFLTDYLIMERRRTPPARRLFHEFQYYLRGCGRSVPEVMARLARFAVHYASLDTGEGLTPAEAGVAGRLRDLGVNVFRPVLMHLLDRHEPAARRDALRALESYVIRRQIIGLPTRNYGSYLAPMLDALDSVDAPHAAVVAELNGRNGEARWPTDEEVIAHIRDKAMFLASPARIRILLLLVEAQLRKPGSETITIDTDELSIEHLMPRTLSAVAWPIQATDPAARAREEQERQALVHTLGNLTLVTEELNKKLSNRSWRFKRPRLLFDSVLNLNHELPKEWDATAIRTRGVELGRHLCAVLPSPATLVGTGSAEPPPPAG
jgi:hypothetical protein